MLSSTYFCYPHSTPKLLPLSFGKYETETAIKGGSVYFYNNYHGRLFFCTLLKKLNHEKNSKNRVQEKNSAKFCPKTQPTAGFSLLKNYKKTPFMKKTGIFAPKTQFFPFKTQCTAGLRPELSCRKVYKKAWYISTFNYPLEYSKFIKNQKF